VKFGVLFADERCADMFEALVGTLRAAKKRKVCDHDPLFATSATYCTALPGLAPKCGLRG
jgi:hypothetical protein